MEPLSMLAIGGGIAAVGALGQWLNSDAARKASAAEVQRITALYNQMQSPNFDMEKLSPQDFKLVGKYVPQTAAFIGEHAPQLVNANSADQQTGRDAQVSAIQKLRQAASGNDPEMAAKIYNANAASAAQAHSLQQNVLADANRRGMLDSGMSIAAQLAGSGQANQTAAMQGQDAAVQSYRTGLQSVKDAANLGGQLRSTDLGIQSTNSNYMNQYYARDAARQQANVDMNTGIQNDAQRYNLGQAQNVANMNTQQTNDYAKYNQQYGNGLQQQGFQNQMGILAGKAGQSQAMRNDLMQSAAATNSAIQGATNAGLGGLQYYGAQQNADRDYALKQQQVNALQSLRGQGYGTYQNPGSYGAGSGYGSNPGSYSMKPDNSDEEI